MDWLRENWYWVAILVFFVWMHAGGHGHGCHGGGGHGHGGHEGHSGSGGAKTGRERSSET